MNRQLSILKTSFFAFCVSLALSRPARATDFFQNDHAFGLSKIQLKYEYLLSGTIFAGFPANATVSFLELPSDSPELGIWMHADSDGYLVVFARSKINLWNACGLGKTDLDGFGDVPALLNNIKRDNLIVFEKRRLVTSIGKRVEDAWHGVVFNVSGGPRHSGNDGVLLVFRAYSERRGLRSWDSWNPGPDSVAGKLRAIALALANYCEGGSVQQLITALDAMPSANGVTGHLKTSHSGSIENQPPERAVMEGV